MYLGNCCRLVTKNEIVVPCLNLAFATATVGTPSSPVHTHAHNFSNLFNGDKDIDFTLQVFFLKELF